MKKEIFEALKAKFMEVSDAILNRIADKIAKTVTTQEQVATAVEGVTFQQVLESYGDSRATEAQQTAVSNYEKKHGLKDGVKVNGSVTETPNTTTQTTQEENEDAPAWAKALIEANNKLTERLNTLEGDRITSSRKQQLNEIIGKLPENLRKAYERTPVDKITEDEFESLKNDITSEVEGIVNETNQKGAVFGKPSVPTGGNGNELSKEQQDAIAKRDATPAADKQPF